MVDPGEPTRFEVLLSALVLPGAGQWVQGRRTPALVYGLLSLVCTAGELWVVLTPMAVNFSRALAMEPGEALPDFAPISIPAILKWLAAFSIVYVVNLIDVHRAYLRRRRAWSSTLNQDP